jgi:hypothetical protein
MPLIAPQNAEDVERLVSTGAGADEEVGSR